MLKVLAKAFVTIVIVVGPPVGLDDNDAQLTYVAHNVYTTQGGGLDSLNEP